MHFCHQAGGEAEDNIARPATIAREVSFFLLAGRLFLSCEGQKINNILFYNVILH
jgi:hypothetical protein